MEQIVNFLVSHIQQEKERDKEIVFERDVEMETD